MTARDTRFPRKARLLASKDFDRLRQKGKKYPFASCTIYVVNEKVAREYPVLGLTVSKKVSKRSVDRNRIKRRVREAFRSLYRELDPSFTFSLVAKEGLLTLKPEAIREILRKVFSQIGGVSNS